MREDLQLLRDAEEQLALAIKPPSGPGAGGLPPGANDEAIKGIEAARKDLEWNVFPTDGAKVAERMVDFTKQLREFIDVVSPRPPAGQFQSALLEEAHKTLAVLRRHHDLASHYDETREARLRRTTTEAGGELNTLETSGQAAKDALMKLLKSVQQSLTRRG